MEDYIRSMYELAVSDYKLAANEEARNKALLEMLRLTSLAAAAIGFEFADSLSQIIQPRG
jgi:hypothetical protein